VRVRTIFGKVFEKAVTIEVPAISGKLGHVVKRYPSGCSDVVGNSGGFLLNGAKGLNSRGAIADHRYSLVLQVDIGIPVVRGRTSVRSGATIRASYQLPVCKTDPLKDSRPGMLGFNGVLLRISTSDGVDRVAKIYFWVPVAPTRMSH